MVSPTPCVVLWLTQFEAGTHNAWLTQQPTRFSPSERARFARITRPLRQEQFIVGHCLLRQLLSALGVHQPEIGVTADGRPYLVAPGPQTQSWYVSLAHSHSAVAALAAQAPMGVDIEKNRPLRNSTGLMHWLANLPLDQAQTHAPVSSALALKLWVASEANIKAHRASTDLPNHKPPFRNTAQIAQWVIPGITNPQTPNHSNSYWLAVSGTTPPCQTALFDMDLGTYNPISLDWQTLN